MTNTASVGGRRQWRRVVASAWLDIARSWSSPQNTRTRPTTPPTDRATKPGVRPNLAPVNSADWYPDPYGRYEYRFHNGSAWTADVSTQGIRYVDPAGLAPSGAPTPSPQRAKRDGLATASMVLGIISLTISWVPILFIVGGICAVLALIFGTIAIRRRKAENGSFAVTGLLTGGAGLLMVGVGVWTTSLVVDEVDEFTNPPPSDVQITRCVVEDSRLVVTGRIENLGNRASDFRILIDVSGIGLRAQRVVVTVDDLQPGAAAPFETPIRGIAAPDDDDTPTCELDEVTGPLPFGFNLETN